MTNLFNFCLLLTIFIILHVSYKGVKGFGAIETFGFDKDLANIIKEKILAKTNFYREKHRMDPLKLNYDISQMAQKNVNLLSKYNTFDHISEDYGVNMAKTPIIANFGETVVDLWYNLIAWVNINNDEGELYNNTILGPMTQLLWRTSTDIGIGVAVNVLSGTIHVKAYFWPRGNEENMYLTNLPTFFQEDIERGIDTLKTFDPKILSSILLSNSRTGVVAITDNDDDPQNIRLPESQLLNLPQPQPSYDNFLYGWDTKSSVQARQINDIEARRIRQRVLERSNFYRNKHGISPFNLNETLNDVAQGWANNLASRCVLEDDPNVSHIIGQNRYSSPMMTFGHFGEMAVDIWYSQIGLLHENMTEEAFHNRVARIDSMTQLLWKSSTLIGVGVAKDFLGHYYVVVDYTPRGNIPDTYLQNLPEFNATEIGEGLDTQILLSRTTPTYKLKHVKKSALNYTLVLVS